MNWHLDVLKEYLKKSQYLKKNYTWCIYGHYFWLSALTLRKGCYVKVSFTGVQTLFRSYVEHNLLQVPWHYIRAQFSRGEALKYHWDTVPRSLGRFSCDKAVNLGRAVVIHICDTHAEGQPRSGRIMLHCCIDKTMKRNEIS